MKRPEEHIQALLTRTGPCNTRRKGRHTQQRNRTRKDAHRWAYEDARGSLAHYQRLRRLCETPGCLNPWHYEPTDARGDIAMSNEMFHDFFLKSATEPPVVVSLPSRELATTLRFRLYSWRKRHEGKLPAQFMDVSISVVELPDGSCQVIGRQPLDIFEHAMRAAGLGADTELTPEEFARLYGGEEDGEETPG